jgi:Calcineurin-like phosphoesterase
VVSSSSGVHQQPSVGNHEYHTPDATGYFGAKAGNPSRGYYTYKRGSWRIIVLNSNCSEVGGCGELSAQSNWLRQTLTNYPVRRTLAYFHHPLFASTGAASPEVRPFWNILYDRNADVILNGHAHYYERFARQRPDGTRDLRRGIREFVVRTGGAPPINPMTSPRVANSVVDSEKSPGTTAYGVLRLRLSASLVCRKLHLEVPPGSGRDLHRLRHRPASLEQYVKRFKTSLHTVQHFSALRPSASACQHFSFRWLRS